jgi:hypothetical protein
VVPDCIQAAIFHWYAPKETTRGEALRPVETSYAEVYARFRWHIPTNFNIGIDVYDRYKGPWRIWPRISLVPLHCHFRRCLDRQRSITGGVTSEPKWSRWSTV